MSTVTDYICLTRLRVKGHLDATLRDVGVWCRTLWQSIDHQRSIECLVQAISLYVEKRGGQEGGLELETNILVQKTIDLEQNAHFNKNLGILDQAM